MSRAHLQQYASFLASATFLESKLLLDFIPGRNTIHRVNAVVLVRLPLGKNLPEVERHASLNDPPPYFLGDNAVVATSFFGLLGIEYIYKQKNAGILKLDWHIFQNLWFLQLQFPRRLWRNIRAIVAKIKLPKKKNL